MRFVTSTTVDSPAAAAGLGGTRGGPAVDDRLNAYYAATADKYDDMRHHNGEHLRAVRIADRLLGDAPVGSILDVGCGTGKVLRWYSEQHPGASLCGVDPSPEMADLARQRVPDADIRVGPGHRLPFADQSVDLVVATGILHHIEHTTEVIEEMFRVARRAVLVSDHNNLAFGHPLVRRARLALFGLGLHKALYFVRNGFRRQGYSAEDGYWYNYSLLDDYRLMAARASQVIVIPTHTPSERAGNFVLCQTHLAVLALTS